MRIAALAFGVLAGLVASLILALGGLDAGQLASAGERPTQIIRFALFVVGNLGFLGGALALALPLTGGLILIIGALAWAGAALLLQATGLAVLIAPPALMLLAAIPAFIAHFRPARSAPQPEPEIIAPLRRSRPADDQFDDGPDMDMPNFGEPPRYAEPPPRFAEPPPRASANFSRDRENERFRPVDDDWNPGKRRTVPPRTRPAFRPVEDDDEPSGFSRFALGASTVLSFGLYAALAGAALLALWTLRDQFTGGPPTVATAEISSEPVSQAATAATSSEPVLAPVLPAATVEPQQPAATPPASRLPALGGAVAPPAETATNSPSPAAPAPLSPAPAAEAMTALPEDNFGEVVMSDDPMAPPRLVESTGLPFDESAVAATTPAPEAPAAAAPAEIAPPAAAEPVIPSTPTIGSMMPRTMTPQMAAMRMAAATGPTTVTSTTTAPARSTSDTGL